MQVYLFSSGSDPTLCAYTLDASGANLPSQHAPWRRSQGAAAVAAASPPANVMREIGATGYYLVSLSPSDEL